MRVTRGIVVACLLLAVPACSNNKGKIVGRWESVPGGVLPPGISMSLEFTQDGRFTMGVNAPGVNKTITGKYSLGFGDSVTLSGLSEPLAGRSTHTEKITIVGSQLTMTDSDGKAVVFKKA